VAADGGAFDFELTVHSADAGALRLVPRIAVLGVGCRRGIGQQAMEEAFAALLAQSGLCAEAFYKVCSIDLKRDEPGLRAFCAAHGFAFETFSAAQLAAVEGRFSSSGFVQSVTGVDIELEVISNEAIEPISRLKTSQLGSHNPRLHPDETLIALSITSASSEVAARVLEGLPLLRGCDAFFSVIISATDEALLKRLGINVCCEPKFERHTFYHR